MFDCFINPFIISSCGCSRSLTWELTWSTGQMRHRGSVCSRNSALDIMAQHTDSWCTLVFFVCVCVCVFVCFCVCVCACMRFRSVELSLKRIAAADKCHAATWSFFFFKCNNQNASSLNLFMLMKEVAQFCNGYWILATHPTCQLTRLHGPRDQPGRNLASRVCWLCVPKWCGCGLKCI